MSRRSAQRTHRISRGAWRYTQSRPTARMPAQALQHALLSTGVNHHRSAELPVFRARFCVLLCISRARFLLLRSRVLNPTVLPPSVAAHGVAPLLREKLLGTHPEPRAPRTQSRTARDASPSGPLAASIGSAVPTRRPDFHRTPPWGPRPSDRGARRSRLSARPTGRARATLRRLPSRGDY